MESQLVSQMSRGWMPVNAYKAASTLSDKHNRPSILKLYSTDNRYRA